MSMKGSVWKLVTIGLGSAIVLMCIVFAIPLKTVPRQTIETYYETEMETESYVVKEPYVTEETLEKSKTLFDGFGTVVPDGFDVPFYIDEPNAQLVVTFQNPFPGGFYIYSAGRIIYEKLGNQGTFEIPLPEGTYKAKFRENLMWGEQVYVRLVMKWTELAEVTRYKERTEYREVPVEVEKQRTVTEYEKVSIWELILGD
ncbi:MAG: hypothetical protein H8E40_15690 [Chloroflexi bacterium]|nr:hypothetical protein [Chloroflexota bacterium]